jgi:phosphoglycerol transferase MdoB-like AlkP superfamily enzyme
MVLQRLQTVYFLISIILMVVFAFFPTLSITLNDGSVYILGVLDSGTKGMMRPDFLLATMDALIVLLTVVAVFKYKNLKSQLRLSAIVISLTLAMVLSIGIIAFTQRSAGDVSLTPYYSMLGFALLFDVLAYRGIAKDKKLLSDSARIR